MPRNVCLAVVLTAGIVCGVAAATQEPKPPATPASPLSWQQVSSSGLPYPGPKLLTYRSRVPGGWLIAVVGQVDQPGNLRPGEIPVGAAFLPDADHRWDVDLVVK